MKTKCLLMCLILIVCTAQAQGLTGHKVYLPLFIFPKMDGTMGLWSYVEPTPTDNLIINSSIEVATTGWAGNAGGEALTRVSTFQKFGVYSLQVVTTGAIGSGAFFDCNAQTAINTQYTFSVWLRGAGTVQIGMFDAVGGLQQSANITLTTIWTRYTFTATFGAGALRRVLIITPDAVAYTYQVDGAQLEQRATETTYCDGDQPGCEWNGAAHASVSQRSALSRAGGQVINFEDLNFDISGMFGAGMSPITVNVDPFAILPGAEINSIKTDERTFTLSGWVTGESPEDLHAKRQAIIDALKPNAVPGNQPVLLRYTGAVLTKEIAATYEAGLAGTIRGEFPCLEQNFTLRFLAADPNWYEIGNSAAVLDTNDTATLRTVTARLRATGQWDDLGPPNVAGTYNITYAFAEDETYVYIGGDFQNFDNNPNSDGIVRYNKQTGAFSAMGTGINGTVYVIAIGPDGTVYAGGLYNSAGGVANTWRIAAWDPVAEVWSALGAGLNAEVEAIAFDLTTGDVFLGGAFTDVQGGPGGTYNYIVRWDGAAYNALGTGANSNVRALVVSKFSGDLFVVGSFTTLDGVAASRAARWDGTNAFALGAGLNGTGYAAVIDSTGALIVGGNFTTAGGNTANRVARWNGAAWGALGSGTNSDVRELSIGVDDILYLAGLFTTAGGIAVTDRMAKWGGSSYAPLDINLPGVPTGFGIMASHIIVDPVVANNYDLWFGFNTTGIAFFSGSVAVINDGTEDAFPVIKISRTGGTSATLIAIRNEILGLDLLFAYGLLDGETLTIDLSPTQKSIVSNFTGSRQDAILANSALGTWHLGPGDNPVTVFVDVVGVPTIVGTLEWRDPYWAAD